MTFLAPWLLAGLALASAPIIIHLLNRRRYINIDWGPMRYLKLAIKQQRRRLQIEHWLLLALRTLLIVLLFLALAQPVLSAGGLASWWTGSAVHRVIVVDDSMSMDVARDGKRSFDRAIQVARRLVEEASARDQITILAATRADTPHAERLDVEGRSTALAAIDQIQLTDASVDWAAALDHVSTLLARHDDDNTQVAIITDQTRVGWQSPWADGPEQWRQTGTDVTLINAGVGQPGQCVLTMLTAWPSPAVVGETVTLTATIRSDSPTTIPAGTATLKFGNVTRPIALPAIEPNATITTTIPVSTNEPGPMVATLTLAQDALARDSRRFVAIDVRERLRVLMIDGNLDPRPLSSETGFLTLALTAGGRVWDIERIDHHQLQPADLLGRDLVVMANVPGIDDVNADRLIDQVRQGTGLMVFVGDMIEPSSLNGQLGPAGRVALLPAALDAPVALESPGIELPTLADSPIAALADLPAESLTSLRARRILPAAVPAPGEVGSDEAIRVLARWRDPDRSPAAIERRLDRGTVLLWTTSANRDWSNWPVLPSYVLTMRETSRKLAATGTGLAQPAGRPMTIPFPTGNSPDAVEMIRPGRQTPQTLQTQRDPNTGKSQAVIAGTPDAGPYNVSWTSPSDGRLVTVLRIANPDIQESDLTRIEADELTQWFAPLNVRVVNAGTLGQDNAATRTAFWPLLIAALLIAAALESAMAAYIGRER